MLHLAALCAATVLGLVPALATAQQQRCAPRGQVVEALADRYGESRQSIGLTADGAVIETFASAESGSWTITVTFPDGRMCLVASGLAFERIADEAVPPGAPA